MIIFDYFQSLSKDEKIKFRNKVLEETGISYPSFYNKMNRNTWRKAEAATIKDIIEKSQCLSE